MGCRKNLKTLSVSERTAFVNAFITIMDNGIADEYANIHSGAGVHGHGGPAFVAWHREYVRRFELELQAVDPNVNLPYWDWTEANLNSAGTESLIWRNDFLGGPGDDSGGGGPTGPGGGYPVTSGPFAGRFTRRPFNIFSFPGTGGTISGHMANPDFNGFRAIEGPHGSAHVFVGGHVVSFATTAGTPDFWLIHCNVDRLWAEWIRNHEASPGFEPYKPLVGGPIGHSLNDSMWPWNGTNVPFGVHPYINSPEIVRPADLLDHLTLGYQYDTIDGCAAIKLPKERIPKEFLPKELKERNPKEFKEFLPKELKERGPKEAKERLPKEFKERGPKEFKEIGPKEINPKELVERDPKNLQEGQLFIDPSLRPDLSGVDLSFEPDITTADVNNLRDNLLSRRANLLRRR
jgi:tyrosinase-like protein